MFEKLLEWIKAHMAEGTDVAEVEALLPTLESILGSKEVISALDSLVSKAVTSHDERYTAETLPGLMEAERAKVRAELNPEETPDQKRIRELEESNATKDAAASLRDRTDTMRTKAAELKVDTFGLLPDDMTALAGLGDKAETVLETFVGRLNETFTKAVDAKVKERFAPVKPGGGDPNMDELAKMRAAGDNDGADRVELQGIYAKSHQAG